MTAAPRLSKRDETLVDLLIAAGMPRNLAKTIVVLWKREATTSVDVEKATGLRQPEVSIAMQELRSRNWVEKSDLKKEGKGRPVHSYHLSVSFPAVVESLTQENRKRIEAMEENLRRLKAFV